MKPRQLITTGLLLALWGSLHAQTVVDPAAAKAAVAVPATAATSDDPKKPPQPDFEPRILRGDDKLINMPPAYVPVEGSPSGYKFEDAPIQDVVTVFMREVLKVDYILHQPITGSVTLATRGPISPDDALSLLESALQVNGLAMGRDSRGVYHVGKLDSLKGVVSNIRVAGTKGSLPPGYGVVIIPLEFIGATEMAAILKPMVQGEAIVRVDTLRNMLVMVGTRNQAEGWMDMVKTFDVNMLKGMSVGVFPLKYASVKEVESALQLLNSGASGGAPAGGAPAAARPAGQSQGTPAGGAAAANTPAVALSENFPLYGAIRVLPIARINSILVVTPRAAYLEEARRWIEKLDKPSDNGAEPQLFIYQVQNGNAQHLASVLSGVFGGMQNNPFQSGGATGATGVAPGMGGAVAGTAGVNNPYGNSNNAFNANLGGVNNAYGGGGGYGGGYGGYGGGVGYGGGAGMFGQNMGSGFSSGGLSNLNTRNTANNANRPSISMAANFGSIRVVADALNNSVLIWSTRAEYEKIEATLKRLDIPPTQVLIEASIIEVTLGDDLEYGLQWYFTDGNKPGSVPNNRTGRGTVGGSVNAAGGFTYQSLNPYGRVQATLTALAEKTHLKVVSSPNLMVLDNHTATIAVGEQRAVNTATTIIPNGTNSTVTNSIQYKDTGVNLVVTPSVNAGNLVTMQVDQMLTDILDKSSDTPSFMQRQVSSKVAVRSGESIVMGGLIKDTESKSKKGVPVLSQIPLLGGLFGTQGSTNDRTELLVVLSPRVVRTDIDIREVSDDLRDRLKG
ncbi:type II secretion system secretin GspD [Diaphorobacter aerolatus]|uniref:Type IV pilus biogenesis and competence protein PilQ n=1 Tax=Diaphorobacter aerolatus TaxID=1288495 RepID=A0A7H0GNU4_9BURK|nr:type II secretion system secretin GspD [Diaphorobacter aerolatus]QNP49960.1 type II secretion system secretin GspD [Diaphorobacter aerolatus]